ncbi:DsrE family protein [Pengzhenrongella frigida]|uniref:Uncharacterized protein n=1 Tax=Pengzhenrongella frigida TaxID=1259133 RepID=A0A4Q5MV97_9MICO|nr:DsrE family protein [Cellulomonas sp. HLT2-17]RYV49415.1 hypothetical protein EUA98_18925 [Cellulomonas sp. HLT2-17]
MGKLTDGGGDSVIAVAAGQKVANEYYNTGKQAANLVAAGAALWCCDTCIPARGLTDDRLLPGAQRFSISEFLEWSTWA